MKKGVKLTLIICTAGILVIAGIVAIIFGVKQSSLRKYESTRVTVGFYEVSQAQQESFTNIIEEISSNASFDVEFYKIEKDQDFEQQINDKKINLILAPAGYAVEKAVDVASESAQIEPAVTGGMFSSMRQLAVTKDNKLKAVPLIFDNLEIDIELSAFNMSGLESIATWDDLEKFAQLQKSEMYPVSFAGAEPVFLLDLLGAMGEALEGYDAYLKAAEILKAAVEEKNADGEFDAAAVANKIFIDPDAPIPYSLYYLKQFIKKGYVTPAARELINTDINSYIQQRVTRCFFTTLSVHRTFDTKAVSRFSTIYVPSKTNAGQRHFTATATFAVPVNSNKNTGVVIEGLLSEQNQAKLSQSTGLAPVLANCRTPDKEADDARYWVAATNTPVAGLGHEAQLTDSELVQLANAINALLFY